MRIWIAILAALLLWLQYSLWFGEQNLRAVWARRSQARQLEHTVDRFKNRNRKLRAEVDDLRKEGGAIAERAREDLGMVRRGEIFIRIVQPPADGPGGGKAAGDHPGHGE